MSQKKSASTSCTLYGGALYLTIKEGVVLCEFMENVGGGLKFHENFDEKPPQNTAKTLTHYDNNGISSSSPSLLTINDCTFENSENFLSSSLLILSNGIAGKTEVNDCAFTGKIQNGSFHIDAQGASQSVHVENCRFESDQKQAINTKTIKADMSRQVFNYKVGGYNDLNSYVKMMLAVASIGVVCCAVVTALVVKKRRNGENEEEEPSENSHNNNIQKKKKNDDLER